MNKKNNNQIYLSPEEKENLKSFSSKKGVGFYSRSDLVDCEEELIRKYFKGKKVLDIGCGCGRTTINLYRMGYEVIGIDISKEMIGQAKKNFKDIPFLVMSACDLKFKDNYFDNILFSLNGIDYIFPKQKRLKALKEIYRVLKPNGVFIFSSHNSWWVPITPWQFKTIIQNIFSLDILKEYRMEVHSFGKLKTYFGNPFSQINQAKEIGFKLLDFRGRWFKSFLKYFEPYLYYVFSK